MDDDAAQALAYHCELLNQEFYEESIVMKEGRDITLTDMERENV